MKTLANCTPTEFLRQTNRIRKDAENWLKVTEVMKIRQRKPALTPESGTDDQIAQIREANQALLEEQAKKNLAEMLDAVLEEHPEETIRVLALCCFIEPEDADNHTVEEYLDAVNDLIGSKAVIRFFTSLAKLGLMDI